MRGIQVLAQKMDAQKCLEILCSRVDCTKHSQCIACESAKLDITDGRTDGINGDGAETNAVLTSGSIEESVDQFIDLSPVDLVTLFTTLQAERVQCYKDFESALDLLIEEIRIGAYTSLCGEMTARFSVISNKIIALETYMRKTGLTEVADLVRKVKSVYKICFR